MRFSPTGITFLSGSYRAYSGRYSSSQPSRSAYPSPAGCVSSGRLSAHRRCIHRGSGQSDNTRRGFFALRNFCQNRQQVAAVGAVRKSKNQVAIAQCACLRGSHCVQRCGRRQVNIAVCVLRITGQGAAVVAAITAGNSTARLPDIAKRHRQNHDAHHAANCADDFANQGVTFLCGLLLV